MKILIVDDEEVVRDSLLMYLENMGHFCKTVADSEEALSMIKDLNPDVVVTDYKMPNVNGFELLKIIKNKYPRIKVVLLTAYANLENAVTASRAGAYGFCRKSQDLSKFTRMIVQIEQEQNDQMLFRGELKS